MNDPRAQHELYDDEIDLKELFQALWKGKLTIIAAGFITTVLAVIVALALPNIYRSEAVVSPVGQEAGGLSGLAAKYGGLASLAGISLPSGDSNKAVIAIEVLRSRDFLQQFISRHDNVLRDLMAVDGWSLDSNELSFDSDDYDAEKKQWVRDVNPPFKPEPSLQEAHEEFVELLSINTDKDSGLITIGIDHYSPYVAQQWVTWVVNDINQITRDQDVEQAEKSIAYLKEQINETAVADLQAGFFEMIQDQIQTIMLAKATPEYLFKTIDPALVPEEKIKPKRALIVALGAVLGGLLGIVLVLVRHYSNKDA